MPRIVHEPWCRIHESGVGQDGSGGCTTEALEFGPASESDLLPIRVGSVNGVRIGQKDPQVFIDYRTKWGGYMDLNALRAIREAVAESPDAFLMVLDALMAAMGNDVPPPMTYAVTGQGVGSRQHSGLRRR